jgi:hypothetical protein
MDKLIAWLIINIGLIRIIVITLNNIEKPEKTITRKFEETSFLKEIYYTIKKFIPFYSGIICSYFLISPCL